MKNRQEFNRQLVKQLSVLVECYPDLRFSQILDNFGYVSTHMEDDVSELTKKMSLTWVNEYNLEPDLLLKRVLGKVTTIGAKLYE